MKIKSFFLAFLAGALALVSCQEQEELGPAKVTVTPETLTFGTDGGSQAVSLTATRDWVVTTPEWMAVDVEKGEGHSKPVTVALSATSNPGNDRTGNVVFSIGLAKAIVTVNQAGSLGPVVYGDGTKANPYTVEGVIQYLEELGADVTSPVKVYVKGKVSAVTEEFTTQYGNGTFNISDDGEATGAQFTAYRVKYLGNKKFASGDAQPKKGDEVILYGSVVNYKGNTPETAQNDAFLFSLNGVDKGGDDGGEGEAKGSGTKEDPFNVAAARAAVKDLTWTANDQYDKVGPYYVKGKISRIADKGTFGESGTYGNATFYISDDGEESNEFYCYRILYFGNQKYTKGTDIKVGDEVVVYAQLMNYRGNTPETVQGSANLYSLNGETGNGDNPDPDDGGDPAGSGTQADPYNVAAALNAVKDLTWTSNDEYQKVGPYYVKGRISRIANNGKYGESGTYGNASFYISDDGAASNEFYCYRILYLGNEKYTTGTDINVGDDVVVCAELMNYKGNTPETVANSGYLVSLTSNGGGGGGGEQPGGEGGDITTSETVTVTGGDHAYVDQAANVNGKDINNVLKLGTSSATGSATITVPGDVSSISFYAVAWNGSSSTKLVFKLNGNTIGTIDPKANSGLKGNAPYTLTVTGDDYYTINLPASSSTSRFAGPFFASAGDKNIEVSTEGDNPRAAIFGIRTDKDPGNSSGGGGGENPPAGDVIAATIAQFLAAAESGTQKYQLTGTISNLANTTYGNFDLVDDSGSVYVYGLTATDLGYGSKNDKSFESLGLAEGDNITIIGYRGSYNGKDEVLNAYFVKKNTSGGGNEGGGGENPPAGDAVVATVAEFLAAAESGTQKYQLTGTISNLTSTTYGNFDLVDDSGSVYVYGLTATDLGYGAKNDKSFGDLGLAEGDNITIIGYRGSYNGKDEVLNAYFVKKNASGGGNDNPGGDNPGGNEGGLFASNVEWTVSKDNASYSEKATVNGTADVPVLKLGTGSKYGTATLTLPEGTTSLTFYAVSWKGQPTAVLFRLDGEDMAYVEPAANDGLSNSSPYTLTVTDNDKYTVTFPATNTIDVVTSGSNKRAGLFAIQAGNEGGSGGGGSTLKPKTVTIAEFIAAEVSSTQPYKIKGTIGNLTNTQYGIFELSDATGTVLINGLTSSNLGYGAKNDFSFSSLGIKETDTITLIGFRSSFNFKPQVDYAYFYSLNASGAGVVAGASGTGTLDDPFNVAAALNAAAPLTWTSSKNYEKAGPYYIKGKISRIANNGTYTQAGDYGNASFYISDDGAQASEFYCYRILYLGNKKYTEYNSAPDIQVGDNVVIYGEIMNYQGNTPETVSATSYLYSLNNATEPASGGGQGEGGQGEGAAAAGSGTLADPYNIAGAIAFVDASGTADVYVKGKVSKVQYEFSNSNGVGTFWISDDGSFHDDASQDFEAYKIKWLENKAWVTGNSQPAVGDEVILCGKLTKYNTTYETSQNEAYVYSWKGSTVDPNQPGTGESDEPGTGGDTSSYVKVTSAPTDWSGTYLLVAESANKAFSGFSSGSTIYGIGTEVTITNGTIASSATVDAYQVVIAAATTTDAAYTIKFGNQYFSWSSGNSLKGASSESENANWTITLEEGNVFITNAADTARKIRWNATSPRFACYTSAQTHVQLYKLAE